MIMPVVLAEARRQLFISVVGKWLHAVTQVNWWAQSFHWTFQECPKCGQEVGGASNELDNGDFTEAGNAQQYNGGGRGGVYRLVMRTSSQSEDVGATSLLPSIQVKKTKKQLHVSVSLSEMSFSVHAVVGIPQKSTSFWSALLDALLNGLSVIGLRTFVKSQRVTVKSL